MRKAQKIERLGFLLPTLFPVTFCMTPELNQARLVRVKFEAELPHALPQIPEKPLCIVPTLESHDGVVHIANHDYLPARTLLPPCFHPQIEYVMQVDVSQQRRSYCPLRRPHLRLRPDTVLRHPGLQPL